MLTNSKDEIEINLRALGIYLKKRIWILIVATLFWGVFLFLLGKWQNEPVYESAARLAVVSGEEISEDMAQQSDENLADYYLEIITSGPVINRVTESCQLDLSYDQFVERLKVYKTSGNNTLNVCFYDRDPQTAKAVVDTICQQALAEMRELTGRGELIFIEEAYVSYEPQRQDLTSWAIYGALGGFGATFFIILFLFLLNDTLKMAEDIERCLEVEVLSEIPVKKKHDIQGKDAYRKLRTNVEYGSASPVLIGVVNFEAQESRQNVAYNLACSYAQSGKRVLYIDANLRKTAEAIKGSKEKKQKTMAEYLHDACSISEVIGNTEIKNLQMISGGAALADSAEILDGVKFKALLEAAGNTFEKVVVYTGSMHTSIDSAIVLRQCDGVLIVMQKEKTRCRLAKAYIRQIQNIGGRILGVVLCND